MDTFLQHRRRVVNKPLSLAYQSFRLLIIRSKHLTTCWTLTRLACLLACSFQHSSLMRADELGSCGNTNNYILLSVDMLPYGSVTG
jgi:hypothetical protein